MLHARNTPLNSNCALCLHDHATIDQHSLEGIGSLCDRCHNTIQQFSAIPLGDNDGGYEDDMDISDSDSDSDSTEGLYEYVDDSTIIDPDNDTESEYDTDSEEYESRVAPEGEIPGFTEICTDCGDEGDEQWVCTCDIDTDSITDFTESAYRDFSDY